MLRAPVGDRYVLEEMQKHNAALGGEQSGHILLPHLATTGDGLLTALVVLDLVARTGKGIDELTEDLKVFPQVIVNVKVREKRPLEWDSGGGRGDSRGGRGAEGFGARGDSLLAGPRRWRA